MKYRTKPATVEAMQWDGLNTVEIMEWTGTRVVDGEELTTFVPLAYPKPQLWVEANQSWVTISPGEWIIRDRLGFYPRQDSVFREKYELVEDAL